MQDKNGKHISDEGIDLEGLEYDKENKVLKGQGSCNAVYSLPIKGTKAEVESVLSPYIVKRPRGEYGTKENWKQVEIRDLLESIGVPVPRMMYCDEKGNLYCSDLSENGKKVCSLFRQCFIGWRGNR